jgi:hypothetical protein
VQLMARRRVSITLDDDVIARARRWAEGRGGLSSYVQEALLERIRRDEEEKLSAEERGRELLAWFEELEAADPSTPEEREEAKRWVARVLGEAEEPA